MLGFSWVFIQLYGPDVYVRYLFWGYVLLAVAVVAAWAAMPELVVRRGRVRGDMIAPAGAIGALGLTLCLSGALRVKRAVVVLAALLFAVVLIASQTRTAFAALLPVLVLGLLFRYSTPAKKVIPVLIVALLLAELFVAWRFGVRRRRQA